MDAVTTLLTVPAIVALVNILKDIGLPSKFAPIAAIILAAGLAMADYFLVSYGFYADLVNALVMALAASGVYDLVRGENLPKRAIPPTE